LVEEPIKPLKKLYQDLMYQNENTLGNLFSFLCDEWDKNWNDSIVVVKKQYGLNDYLEMAEKCIADYYNRYKPFNHGKTISLEERILINLDESDDYRLCGYVDRLTKAEDGCYEIHDYKTCSRLSSLETTETDRQLALYSIGVKERYPDVKNIRLVWHFLKFDREIDSVRTDAELEELKKNTIQLIDTIENTEEFPTHPSKLCDWCKFKPMCSQ